MIFIPGMAANWFQQETMVCHSQSDARDRQGSGLQNQGLVCCEITVKSRKTEVTNYCYKEEAEGRETLKNVAKYDLANYQDEARVGFEVL